MQTTANLISDFYGNEKIKTFIVGCVNGKGFPSSLIISGPVGSGRHTAAKIISQAINCVGEGRPCGECVSCRKIADGDSPDITFIGLKDGRKYISVDDVRYISENAYISPSESKCRVFIIENADLMNENAQNALLKLFEEPPAFVHFILICEIAERLLATVRSRAPVLYTEVFDDGSLTDYLVKHDINAARVFETDSERFKEAIRFSQGSIGRAQTLLCSKTVSKATEYANGIINTVTFGTQSELIILLKKAFDTRDNASDVLSATLNALRDIVSCKRNKEDIPLLFYVSREKACECGNQLSLRFVLSAYSVILDYLRKIQIDNVNINTASVALAAAVWQAKKR